MDAWDREHAHIGDMCNEGLITPEEAQKLHAEIDRDYQESALEAAERAYRDELERW